MRRQVARSRVRQAASQILDELAQTGQDGHVIRNLLKITADWTAFELAQDEYKARAVVQKARELVAHLPKLMRERRRIAMQR
ncbi:hypothetical protein [Bradyrhizobium sp. SBR1B]|uniref:hypothetical protein n=1 Tax=Bradyrhizobium sp. SBR1B TaxID=2663836 RepID=UPI001606E734|nr:hypothetical protein [Bradyrhizobium sp. SBR1B]MBB4379989.1 hypothetical protein [Bradyrhizobium sp. SBR1B]